MTWARVKPWLRRFLGVTINGGLLAIITLADIMQALDVASVDWSDVFGSEQGKRVTQGVLIANVVLRAFVTRTRGTPDA